MKGAIIGLIILVVILIIVIFVLYAMLVVKDHKHETLKKVWEYDINYYRKDNQRLHTRVNRLVSELCSEKRKNNKEKTDE